MDRSPTLGHGSLFRAFLLEHISKCPKELQSRTFFDKLSLIDIILGYFLKIPWKLMHLEHFFGSVLKAI
jgi:hypothetical protein